MIISKSISKLIGASLCVASLLASCNTPTTEQTNATVAVDTSKIVIENIMARRSIRQYKPQPVNRDTMQIILNCGINAPNGQNKQSWAIRVVDNPEFINGITEVFKEKNPAAKNLRASRTCSVMLPPSYSSQMTHPTTCRKSTADFSVKT